MLAAGATGVTAAGVLQIPVSIESNRAQMKRVMITRSERMERVRRERRRVQWETLGEEREEEWMTQEL